MTNDPSTPASTESKTVDDGAPGTGTKPGLPRWRRILVAVLVVFGCILAPLSIVSVWIHSTLLDTDQWVSTVGPLIHNPDVQDAVATRVTNAITENAKLTDKITDALPDPAKRLAPFIEQGAQQAVGVAAHKIVESDQFASLWNTVNRRAHARVVAVLQGKGTQTVQTKNGQITITLAPIIDEVRKELDNRGITFFDNVKISGTKNQIVLFSSNDLKTAQSAVDLFDKVAVVLPILTFLVFAAAIILSGNRRRTVLRSALGVALAMGILLTASALGRTAYLDALPVTVNHAAAQAVYDQLLTFLRTSLRTMFWLAIVVALGAWVAGTSKAATRVRSTVGRALDKGGDEVSTPAPIAGFVAHYRNVLRVVVVGAAFVVMAVIDHPTPLSVLVVTLLALLAFAVIEVLGRAGETAAS
jgi:hypothetical protein